MPQACWKARTGETVVRPRWEGIAAIVVGCTCAAGGTLLSKRLLASTPSLPLVFAQLAIGTVAIWILAFATGRTPARSRLLMLGTPGLLQPGLSFTLSFVGLAMTPVSVEGLLFAFESVLVVLLAWPLIGERPSWVTLLGAVLGAAGIVLIDAGAPPTAAAPLLGVALILAGVAAAALDTVASRRLATTDDSLALTAASSTVGLILVSMTAPFWPHGWAHSLASPGALMLVTLSGVLLHAAAVGSFNFGLSRLQAGAAAALFPLISVLTAAGGVLWFGETLTLAQLTGGALVIAVSLLVAWNMGKH